MGDWKPVKIGDNVYCDAKFGDEIRIFTVIKETPKLWVLNNGMRIRKVDGGIVGADTYAPHYVQNVTPDILVKFRKQRIQSHFDSIKWELVTDEEYDRLEAHIKFIQQLKKRGR